MTPVPPKFSAWLLRLSTFASDREHIMGDALERYQELIASSGRLAADHWYREQARRSFFENLSAVPAKLNAAVFDSGKDIRFAFRQLLRAPLFSLSVILTLGLGIGANTTVFTFVHAFLLRSLPFPDAEQLCSIYTLVDGERGRLSIREIDDIRSSSWSFTSIAGYRDSAYNYGGDGQPAEHLQITRATGELFSVLGVKPHFGSIWPSSHDRTRSFTIALSHELWVRRFGSDPAVIGRQVMMDGFPNTVAAVMPRQFQFPSHVALFRCWGIDANPLSYEQRDRRLAWAVARLRPGVPIESAQAELKSIAARIGGAHPATNARIDFLVTPLRDTYTGDARPYLLALSGAVVFVLLLVCTNVAGLLLARGSTRAHEIAVRAALGASTTRITRQIFVESSVLTVIGGLAGFALCHWMTGALSDWIRIEFAPWMQVGVDGTVAFYCFAITAVTAVLAGALPSWRTGRAPLADALKRGGRTQAARSPLRNALVTAQMAIAVVLITGAGLLIQSFIRLSRTDVGFDATNLVKFHVGLSWKKYNVERATRFQEEILARMRAIPGVQTAVLNTNFPFAGSQTTATLTKFEDQADQRTRQLQVSVQRTSADYHRALRIPLVRGRLFDDSDDGRTRPVAIVSRRTAQAFWPGEDAIGKRILPADVLRPWAPEWITVVGVVADIKSTSPAAIPGMDLYLPHRQVGAQYADFAMRTSQRLSTLMPAIQREASQVDPEEPVSEAATVQQMIADSTWQQRVTGVLLAAFAGIALLLAGVGLYALVAHTVQQRTRELGIRSALGATRKDLLQMVLLDGLRPVLLGATLGVLLALALSRMIAGLLFEVDPADLPTFLLTPALLGVVGLAACLAPALRASRIDPILTLRSD